VHVRRAIGQRVAPDLQHTAHSTGAHVGEPIAETQHRHGPCRDGRHAYPTPAICTGTKSAHPTHTYSRTRTETGLSSPTSGPGLGGYTSPPHLRRDGRAGTGPSHAAARGLRMAAPTEAGPCGAP
jgi:hypothetical protein